MAAVDQQEIVEDDAFLLQRARRRAASSRGDAADIGVVPTVGDEEQNAAPGSSKPG